MRGLWQNRVLPGTLDGIYVEITEGTICYSDKKILYLKRYTMEGEDQVTEYYDVHMSIFGSSQFKKKDTNVYLVRLDSCLFHAVVHEYRRWAGGQVVDAVEKNTYACTQAQDRTDWVEVETPDGVTSWTTYHTMSIDWSPGGNFWDPEILLRFRAGRGSGIPSYKRLTFPVQEYRYLKTYYFGEKRYSESTWNYENMLVFS